MYSKHCQAFKMERFAKRIMPDCRCTTRHFSGQGLGEVCGTSGIQYRFLQKHQKKKPGRETFKSLFSYSWNYILNGKFNRKMDTIEAFLSKIMKLFLTFKKGNGDLPLVALVWVWLNIYQYPWICLNILENAWINCFDYARVLNIHDHVTCPASFWRWLRF